jgi:hypothetical protein
VRHLHGTTRMVAGLFATLLFTVGGLVMAAHAARNTPGLTATQATTCIQTATAAQSGMLTKVEVEEKSGQQLCEVGIVDSNGKKHRVQVTVSATKLGTSPMRRGKCSGRRARSFAGRPHPRDERSALCGGSVRLRDCQEESEGCDGGNAL